MSTSPVSSITRSSIRNPNDKLNILTGCTHARYETGLAKTEHNFFAFQHESFVKGWHKSQAPQPDNYRVFDINLKDRQIPEYLDFDLVLSQNKFGQFQILSQIANQLHLPLVSLEHTLPVPMWPATTLMNCQNMRGCINVFISDYSIDKWEWDVQKDTIVIRHGVDTELFTPLGLKREKCILTVVNDYIGRDWCKPAGQKILTNLGYINIEDVKIGQKALSDNGVFNTIVQTTERDYFGPMVFLTINGYQKEIAFTPTHNIRVFRNNQWQYIDSIRLKPYDVLRFPKLEQTEFYNIEEDYAYLIGSIIADGSITNKGLIEICCEEQDIDRANLLMSLLKKYTTHGNISERDRKSGKAKVLRVECKSKIFGNWLKTKIGGKSYEKSIPDFLFNSSDKVKLATLKGLWDCDGSLKSGKNNRLCYSTISIKLASQVSALLHNFGIKCVIRKEIRKTNKTNGEIKWIYRVVSQEANQVEKCKKLIQENPNNDIIYPPYTYHITNVRINEEWSGKVYNCTVDKDPSYVVYPGFVAHNCLNFRQYQKVTQGLPVCPVGDTKGLSKAASSQEELIAIYNFSEVFLNTAHISPIPTSLLEAMSCECACVSVKASAIGEYIEHGVNGFLAETDKEMRKYLEILLADEKLCRQFGQAARETIIEKCSMPRFVNEWNQVFEKAAQGVYRG